MIFTTEFAAKLLGDPPYFLLVNWMDS
jgi:hypothetical protein